MGFLNRTGMTNKKFKITVKTPTGKKVVSVTEKNTESALKRVLEGHQNLEVLNVIEKPIRWIPK